ncbi:MAG: MATE family efflux transporter [Lachnospiraceae bacterium]|nr:MATE family efflux transporter [Lachnospiraceae bacterium]
MAVPTVVGQLIVLIYSMADTFFVGRTNNPDMVAATSLLLPVFNLSIPLAGVAGVGGGALIARLLGEGRERECSKVYSFCVYLSIILAVCFASGVFLFMDPLLTLLGANEANHAFARTYAMCVIVAGALPTILTNVFANMVRSIGESGKAGFGVTMGGIINIILDPLFMFVILPPGYEILGAGIATCLSNCITCLYFILTVFKLRHMNILRLMRPGIFPEKKSIRGVFAVGVPAAVATLLFDCDYIVLDKLMSGYGNHALAAVGIVLKAERLPLNIGIGICQAMVPIVAYNYASGDHVRMRAVANFSKRCGMICALVSIAMYECFAPYIMRFFIDEPQTVALGTDFLRIRCLATILMFLSFFHVHLFNGYGRGKEALFLGVMRWAVFNIPMLFVLNAIFGIYGLVWAQFTADALTVALSVWTHNHYLAKMKKSSNFTEN